MNFLLWNYSSNFNIKNKIYVFIKDKKFPFYQFIIFYKFRSIIYFLKLMLFIIEVITNDIYGAASKF